MNDHPDYILIQGTVYKLVRSWRRRDYEYYYLRQSIPPGAVPGKKPKQKVKYPLYNIPEHEAITPERAKEIIEKSVEEYDARWKAAEASA